MKNVIESRMPAGFDDDLSPYFVSEELRPHYDMGVGDNTSGDALAFRLRGIGGAKRAWAAAPLEAEYRARIAETSDTISGHAEARSIKAEFDGLLEQRMDEFAGKKEVEQLDFARHLFNLDAARKRLQRTTQREAAQAAAVRRDTCPECGECDVIVRGDVQNRRLVEGIRRSPRVRSCFICYSAYSAAYLEALTGTKTGESGDGPLDLASPSERGAKLVQRLLADRK